MSSSFKTKSILSQQNVESLVSSGVQKAIKETGQGREGRVNANKNTHRGIGRVLEKKACLHTFRRHYGTIWLSPTNLLLL